MTIQQTALEIFEQYKISLSADLDLDTAILTNDQEITAEQQTIVDRIDLLLEQENIDKMSILSALLNLSRT